MTNPKASKMPQKKKPANRLPTPYTAYDPQNHQSIKLTTNHNKASTMAKYRNIATTLFFMLIS